jgi:hypothetical protein
MKLKNKDFLKINAAGFDSYFINRGYFHCYSVVVVVVLVVVIDDVVVVIVQERHWHLGDSMFYSNHGKEYVYT